MDYSFVILSVLLLIVLIFDFYLFLSINEDNKSFNSVTSSVANFTDLNVSGDATFNTLHATGDVTASNLSGNNSGDQNVFTAVDVDSTLIQSSGNDTLKLVSGSGITLTPSVSNKEILIDTSFTPTSSFRNIAVPSQPVIIATTPTSTLNIAGGAGINLISNNTSKTLTISATAAEPNTFDEIVVSGQPSVTADTPSTVLNYSAGAGMVITTDNTSKTVTFSTTTAEPNTFDEIGVSGQPSVTADTPSSVLNFAGSNGMAITTNNTTKTVTFTPPPSFNQFAVAGQSSINASSSPLVQFVAGSNVNLTTSGNTLTIASTGGGGGSNTFSEIDVSGQPAVTATSPSTVLNYAAGAGMAITTDNTSKTVTFASTVTQPNTFGNVIVSGQGNVTAGVPADSLTLVGGSGVTLTTNPGSKSVTISASSTPTVGAALYTKTQRQTIPNDPVTSTAIGFDTEVYSTTAVFSPINANDAFINTSSSSKIVTISYSVRFYDDNAANGAIGNIWIQKTDVNGVPSGTFFAQNYQTLTLLPGAPTPTIDTSFTGTCTIQVNANEGFSVFMYRQSLGTVTIGGNPTDPYPLPNFYVSSLSLVYY